MARTRSKILAAALAICLFGDMVRPALAASDTSVVSAQISDRIAKGDMKLSEGAYTVPADAQTYESQGFENIELSDQVSPPAAPPSRRGGAHRKPEPVRGPSDYRAYAQAILTRLIASPAMPEAKRSMAVPQFDIINARNFNCVVTVQLHIACTEEILRQLVEDKHAVNENMLAFVLAHELSHIILNHRDRIGREEKLRANISTLSTTAGIVLLFAKSNYAKSGNTVMITATHGASNALMYSLVGGAYSSHKAQVLLGPAWSRKDEDEADALGLALMDGAGYDASGATAFIERTQESIAEASKKSSAFEKELQTSAIGGAVLSAILSKGDVKTIAASTILFGLDKYIDYRGDVYHHDPKKRLATMQGMISKYYPPRAEIAGLKKAAGKAVPGEAEQAFILALQHGDHENVVRETFLTKGAQAAAALCLGISALNGEHEICGISLLLIGRAHEGRDLLVPVLKDSHSPPHYFEEIALAYAASGDKTAAMSALDAGSQVYADGRYYPVRMHILHDLGDKDALKLATDSCKSKASPPNKLACVQLDAAYQHPAQS